MPHSDMTSPQPSAHLRHQITFATSRSLAYVSVLELGTVWERTLRRAHIPLKYSQGYNPRPRMHFAAPLPVGSGSDADLLDIALHETLSSGAIQQALTGVTPPDLSVLNVVAVPDHAPSLSDRLQETIYSVWLRGIEQEAVLRAIETFLQAESIELPRRGRRYRGKTYDLKPLVNTLTLDHEAPSPWVGLQMRLSARPGATGRPDEVLKALSLSEIPRRCTRKELILEPLPEPLVE